MEIKGAHLFLSGEANAIRNLMGRKQSRMGAFREKNSLQKKKLEGWLWVCYHQGYGDDKIAVDAGIFEDEGVLKRKGRKTQEASPNKKKGGKSALRRAVNC